MKNLKFEAAVNSLKGIYRVPSLAECEARETERRAEALWRSMQGVAARELERLESPLPAPKRKGRKQAEPAPEAPAEPEWKKPPYRIAFQPKKVRFLNLIKPDQDPFAGLTKEGFATQGHFMVKPRQPVELAELDTSYPIDPKQFSLPLRVASEFFNGHKEGTKPTSLDCPMVILVSGTAKKLAEHTVKAKYLNAVLTEHPDAKPFADPACRRVAGSVVFKVGEEVVGLIMPVLQVDPVVNPDEPASGSKEEKNSEKPADPPAEPPAVETPFETGIQPANGGGFDVLLNGKFRGWKKDLPAAEELLKKAKARNGEPAAAGPPQPAPAEESASAKKPGKTPQKESKTAEKAAPEAPEAPQTAAEAELSEVQKAILAALPDSVILAEAERRGLLKPAAPRRPAANREEHASMTRKAWDKARELAAEKGGKPTDHMKQAWELIR